MNDNSGDDFDAIAEDIAENVSCFVHGKIDTGNGDPRPAIAGLVEVLTIYSLIAISMGHPVMEVVGRALNQYQEGINSGLSKMKLDAQPTEGNA